jgi:hypothetical protein
MMMMRAWEKGLYQRGIILMMFIVLFVTGNAYAQTEFKKEIVSVLKASVLKEAQWALQQEPVTVTAETSERSAGGPHDFYSEGDYWWPDPNHPDGPYIQRDGLTNPDNFTAHRKAMIRFSRIVGALISAWKLTGDKKYTDHAKLHLTAWFIHPETRMNPNLQFAQAIKGRATGRGIGIIDTIHLMEVAQGVVVMMRSKIIDEQTAKGVQQWFRDYLQWLHDHPYGHEEMMAKNNHGTCWVMQVASFAVLTNDQAILEFCRKRYESVLLPDQMAVDGSFPLEIKRTKPYGYSIFNLDALTMVSHILSTGERNLWDFKTTDGKNIGKGVEFLFPYLKNKNTWPYPKDVMYWENWPVAQPSLLFGAIAFSRRDWFEVWKAADHEPAVDEIIRNLPIRHPLLWIE